MYKSQIKTWFTIAFISLFAPIFGQTITTNTPTSLKTENPINKIYDSYAFDNEIVLLTDSRKNGQLDILIVTLDKHNKVVREQVIGRAEAYDRPVGLIKKKDGYWLCVNSVQNGNRIFTLYELDKTFVLINSKSIPIKNLDEVTALKYNEQNQSLLFTATLIDTKENMYPRLIKYDLTNHRIIESIDFNNRTDKSLGFTKKDTFKSVVYDLYIPHFKQCNQIKCIDDNCSEIVLVGQEMSARKIGYKSIHTTDFWVTTVKDNRIVWEKIYKTSVGGDIAMDIFIDEESKNILVGGIGYNKTMKEMDDYNYHYRIIQLDENGELLKSHFYTPKGNRNIKNTRSFYSEMKSIGDNYLMIGRTEDVIYAANETFEENGQTYIVLGDPKIVLSDLSFVLVDKNGNLKTKQLIETENLDVPYSLVVLSDEKMLLIFSSNEENKIYKMLEISVTE